VVDGILRCQQQHVSVQRGATPFGRSRQRPVHRSTIRTPDNTRESSTSLVYRPSQVPLSATEVLCQGLELVDEIVPRGSLAITFRRLLSGRCLGLSTRFLLPLPLSAPDARASSSFAWSCLASTTEELGFSSEADSTASSFDFASRYCCCARSSSPFIEAVRASLTSR